MDSEGDKSLFIVFPVKIETKSEHLSFVGN